MLLKALVNTIYLDILDDYILKNKYEKEFFYIYCDTDESIKSKIPDIINSIYGII